MVTVYLLLIIDQLVGEYKCEHPPLMLYYTIAKNIIDNFFYLICLLVLWNNIEANNLAYHES